MLQNKKIFTFLIISLLLLAVSVSPAFSQYNIETDTDISWITGDITISASSPIPVSATNLTSERFRITESIDRGLTEIVTEAFDEIYLDSLRSLKDGFVSDSRMMSEFDTLNLNKSRVSSSMSLDLDYVTNIYKYNIFEDLVPILTAHERPAPLPAMLEYEPTAVFSGIIIYAADPLPYYGEDGRGILNPAVFPKIFNSDMELIASPAMADPDYLKRWGFILYTDSLDEKQLEQRIGLYPFRTTAEAVFGTNHTDIIISDNAARKLLYNEENHRLFREGRIVVIIGPEETPEN